MKLKRQNRAYCQPFSAAFRSSNSFTLGLPAFLRSAQTRPYSAASSAQARQKQKRRIETKKRKRRGEERRTRRGREREEAHRDGERGQKKTRESKSSGKRERATETVLRCPCPGLGLPGRPLQYYDNAAPGSSLPTTLPPPASKPRPPSPLPSDLARARRFSGSGWGAQGGFRVAQDPRAVP